MFLGITGLEIIFFLLLFVVIFVVMMGVAFGMILNSLMVAMETIFDYFRENLYVALALIVAIAITVSGVWQEVLVATILIALIGTVIVGIFFSGPFLLRVFRDLVETIQLNRQQNKIKRQRKEFIHSSAEQWLMAQYIPVMEVEQVNSYMYMMVKKGNRLYPTPAFYREMNQFISSELQIKESSGELELQVHRLEIVRCQIAARLKIYFDVDEKNKCLVKPNH